MLEKLMNKLGVRWFIYTMIAAVVGWVALAIYLANNSFIGFLILLIVTAAEVVIAKLKG